MTQSGALAQQILRAQGRAFQESQSRDTTPIDLEAPQHEPPPTVTIPPSVALSAAPLPVVGPAALLSGVPAVGISDSKPGGIADSKEDSDFLAKFFGFSEVGPVPAPPYPAESVGQSAAEEPHGVPFAEAAMSPAPAAEADVESTESATEQAQPSPVVGQSLALPSALVPDGAELMDPATMLDLLSRLMAQHAPKKERPRPKEWSRGWAIQELKRRVLDLGEMGFLMTITQPRRLLLFVRELGEAIRPPDLRPLPAPG